MAQDREAVLQKRGACGGNPTYLVEGDELPENAKKQTATILSVSSYTQSQKPWASHKSATNRS